MAEGNLTGTAEASWLGPEKDENELRRYLTTLRHRGWLIVATMLVAVLLAVAYVQHATPVYQAQSSLLVSSVANGTSVPSNIPGLLYQSADPTRDIQTAANVVNSMQTAQAVKSKLRLQQSAAQILGDISVQPVSDSNVLAVTAKASSAAAAARLANAFANQTIALRTARFHHALDQQIAGLKSQVAASPGGASAGSTSSSGSTSLASQVAQLQTLRAGPLPDMSISAAASPPDGRTSPRAFFSLAAALIVGLVFGILAVLVLEAFDSTLRREEQLRTVMRLPILARIPREREHDTSRIPFARLLRAPTLPRTPDSLSFPTLESFRTLRAMLLASRTPGQPVPRTLLVTGSAPSEGKTTTALNLALSLAQSGSSVILIEGDLRRPAIGKTLGLGAVHDVTSVVTGDVTLAQALVTSKRYPNVKFLLAEGLSSRGTYGGDALFLPTVRELLRESEKLADYVVVDSPPLLAVIDALELAREADSVLLVAQLGRTDLRRLATLGSLLAEAHIDPVGIALIGAELPGGPSDYDYQYQQPARPSASGGSQSTVRLSPIGSQTAPAPEQDDEPKSARQRAVHRSTTMRD